MAKASEMNNGGQSGNGEPYFCKECKRNHTKGKIYKEHLKFARFEIDKKEIEEESENNEKKLESEVEEIFEGLEEEEDNII